MKIFQARNSLYLISLTQKPDDTAARKHLPYDDVKKNLDVASIANSTPPIGAPKAAATPTEAAAEYISFRRD